MLVRHKVLAKTIIYKLKIVCFSFYKFLKLVYAENLIILQITKKNVTFFFNIIIKIKKTNRRKTSIGN